MRDWQELLAIVEANWLAFGLALVIGLLVAWWLWGRSKARLRERHRAPDALDEGAAPAARNQALIDAPSAVTVARLADSGPNIFAGIGEAIAIGAAREVEAAKHPPAPTPPEPEPVAPPPAPEPAPVRTAPPKAKPAAKPKAAAKPKVAPKAKAEPKAMAVPKPKAQAKPKAEPEAKALPKPEAAPKPKAGPKTKAAPVPKTGPAIAVAPVVQAPPPPAPASPPPAPVPTAFATGADDLARIKGLGPKLQALLPTLGVTTFAQIAAWDDAEIDRVDAQLGVFQGRIRKDNWVEQARFLAGGDVAGYEAKFGKL